MKPTGNTILITGGTSGIGLGLGLRLHDAGNAVVLAGRRRELLDDIVAGHPGIAAVVLDVADPASVAAAATEVLHRFPALNVLVNNAGIMLPEQLAGGGDTAVAEATVTTNLLGPIRMTAALVPHLAAQDDAVVLNVSSGLAFVPLAATPTYSATKAALHSWTQSLREQLAPAGVQVLELVPPAVRTALMGQGDSPHAMPLEDFLDEVVSLLRTRPDEPEVLVEGVRRLRFAEATGSWGEVFAALSGRS